jgi:hypothetical protein
MLTGTPWRVSSIMRPEPTSFTDRASRVYLRGQIHCSQRRTGGMALRCTKKPANVIWYSADKAERRIAMPPLWNKVPRRKFCTPCQLVADERSLGILTKRVIAKL